VAWLLQPENRSKGWIKLFATLEALLLLAAQWQRHSAACAAAALGVLVAWLLQLQQGLDRTDSNIRRGSFAATAQQLNHLLLRLPWDCSWVWLLQLNNCSKGWIKL
jgi:hypothetical protein